MMPDEEFDHPDTNYYILMEELKNKIKNIQLDLQSIRDPELKGFAEKRYSDLKIEYFRLLKDYASFVLLSKDFEEQDLVDNEEEVN